MIKNRNLSTDSKVKTAVSGNIDISNTALQTQVLLYDPLRDIQIISVVAVFTADGDTAPIQIVDIGTQADDNLYAAFSPNIVADTNQIGDVEAATLLVTTVLPAGTPLLASRTNATAAANTLEFVFVVSYELIDRTSGV